MGLFDRWRASTPDQQMTPSPGSPRRDVLEINDPDAVGHDGIAVDDAVREHLARLSAAADTDAGTITPQEFDEALTSRLVSYDDLPPDARYHYVAPFTDHVAEVLTLDLPGTVVTLDTDRLAASGRPLPKLIGLGRRNLQRHLETEPVEVVRVGGRGGCTAVIGDSPYTASAARFLSEAMLRWLPDADTGNGVVFALPNRHTILLQPCSSAAETRAALEVVPAEAQRWHAAGPGPLSKHVYHWYHREVSVLTAEQPDGSLAVETTPLLEGILGHTRHAG